MQKHFVDPRDLAVCRALLRGGSRSFFAASLLLPARVRDPATALYAFCRVADDAVDLGGDPVAALAELRERLDAAYAGRPANNAIDRAFGQTVAAFEIPKSLPLALIEGLAWDAEGRRYENFPALLDYAARVAGAVGVMMAMVMGVRDAGSLARAADLGIAMQLTNIARDVGEDARAGRIFLPLEWLRQADIDMAEFLREPHFTTQLGGVVQRLLQEADSLYAAARSGLARLPLDCRVGINAARLIYAAIGNEIALADYDTVSRRARVAAARKLRLAVAATAACMPGKAGATPPMLNATLFLVRDARADDARIAPVGGFEKLVTMFERLERSQRLSQAQPRKSLA
jgi:phytoene synthase